MRVRDRNNQFGNLNFTSSNQEENVKTHDFEDPLHPFTRRRILFKKGIELDEDQGFYLVEISKSEKLLFIVAYDIQNMGITYML